MLKLPELGIELELATEASGINGFINENSPNNPTWSISVDCGDARLLPIEDESDEDLEERREWMEFATGEGCEASISGLVLPVGNWRELSSQQVFAEYERSGRIMPGDPGEFFFDTHHWSANQNQIKFGTRQGNRFPVFWKFLAEDDEENMAQVEVDAILPFREFRVWFDSLNESSSAKAVQLVSQFADPAELGEPTESFHHYVDIPILAQSS